MSFVRSLVPLALPAILLLAPLVSRLGMGRDEATAAEQFLFDRQEAGFVAFGIVAFLAWNRRSALRRLPPARAFSVASTCALLLCVLATALLFWSRRIDALDLYLFGSIALAAGFVLLAKGWAGWRVLAIPLLLSFFVLPLPSMLYNEIVWSAQQAATDWAAAILVAFGYPISTGSMMITLGDHDFWVIETCSGLRAAELLFLMSIVILEIAPDRTRLDALLVILAAPLALALNTLRISAIVAWDHEQANASDHVAQGLVAVFVGSLTLFALQRLFARLFETRPQPAHAVETPVDPGDDRRGLARGLIPIYAVTALLLIPLPWVSSFPPQHEHGPRFDAFPLTLAGWESEPRETNWMFFNQLPLGQTLHRRYSQTAENGRARVVDVLLVQKRGSSQRLSLSSSKLAFLGPDWESRVGEEAQIWQTGHAGRWHDATRANERFLVLTWKISAAGRLREISDPFLGLQRQPDAQPMYPLWIRLASPVLGEAGSARARERAKQSIYRFLDDFGPKLAALEDVYDSSGPRR